MRYILTSEGKIEHNAGTFAYQYFHKDHLGNTHVTYKQNGEIVQTADYYPFGLRHEPMALEDASQKYLYNGKELQPELEWYDYGARMYDAALGRFFTQDRFAEKYVDFSPYQYAANNPALIIDVNGDSIWYTIKDNVITMHITAKIMNQSNDDIDMTETISDLTSDIKNTFKGEFEFNGVTYTLKTDVQLEEASTMEDVKDSDHLMILADGADEPGYARGVASDIGGKVTYINSGDYPTNKWYSPGWSNTRTALHELGHLAGLYHNSTETNRNLMKQKGSGFNLSSNQLIWLAGKNGTEEINKGSNFIRLPNGSKAPNPIFYDYKTERHYMIHNNNLGNIQETYTPE